jgi:hypothetical protein
MAEKRWGTRPIGELLLLNLIGCIAVARAGKIPDNLTQVKIATAKLKSNIRR